MPMETCLSRPPWELGGKVTEILAQYHVHLLSPILGSMTTGDIKDTFLLYVPCHLKSLIF